MATVDYLLAIGRGANFRFITTEEASREAENPKEDERGKKILPYVLATLPKRVDDEGLIRVARAISEKAEMQEAKLSVGVPNEVTPKVRPEGGIGYMFFLNYAGSGGQVQVDLD